MSRLTDLNDAIDAAITNKTEDGSISPTDEGEAMKAVAAYANPSSAGCVRGIITPSEDNGGFNLSELENTMVNDVGFQYHASAIKNGVGDYYFRFSAGISGPAILDPTLFWFNIVNDNLAVDAVIKTSYDGDNGRLSLKMYSGGVLADGVLTNAPYEFILYPS